MFKIIINFLLIFSFILPSICLAQGIEQPQTVAEAEGLGLKILTALPDAIKKVWQEEALPLILKMWTWAKSFWDSYLGAQVNSLWNKLLKLTGKETSPNLKEEFQKEKQEMQKDLWTRFKDLLK